MFRLEKTFRFEASHQLPHHDGKCARLHGHSWVGRVIIEAPDWELKRTGSKAGMLVDFGDISKALDPLVENLLDHYHLNESLEIENPTSEEISRWIYNYLYPRIPHLAAIVIEETCTSRAEYRR
jgi:6-pyruvoyltetrahydropterin/6-carboxytetrahydropterin synthase